MPELPDLEVFSHNLHKHLHGKVVKDVTLSAKAKIKEGAAAYRKALEGQKLTKVYREGKELRFQFSDNTLLGMHLMLHGKLYYFDGKEVPKYTVMALHFEDDKGLALTDFQSAAHPMLNPEEKEVPDAMSKAFTAEYLQQQLTAKKTVVKKMLLDQNVVRGIGNAYADEIFYEAGLSPFSVSNKIPAANVKALHKAIHKVLTDAEKEIRKINPDIIAGEERSFMKVHKPHAKETPDGATIHQKEINGRKTYYTDDQELFE